MNRRDKWEMHCRGEKTFKTFSLVLFFWMRIVMSKFLVYNVSINYLQSTQNIPSTKNLDWYISIKYLVPYWPNSHFPYYFLAVNERIPKNRIRILSDIKKTDSEALKVRYFLKYSTKYPTFRASESKSLIRIWFG